MICCLKAKFSRASARCDFIDEKSDATTARISANIMAPMLKPAGIKVNEFKAIEFLGGTDLDHCVEVHEPIVDRACRSFVLTVARTLGP